MAKSRVTIVGLGLIGTSIGLALKKAKVDVELVGHDKDASAAGRAQKLAAVDRTEWNLHAACEGASLIILALPLAGVKDTLSALVPSLQPDMIITDTAATKAPVMEWAKALPPGVQFVGGNPILSPRRESSVRADPSHKGAIDAADAALFQDTTYALTASTTASPQAIDTMANFVALLGAKPLFIDAVEHDGLTAGVHHLPALLAAALEAVTIQSQGWRELGKLAGANYAAATNLAPQDARTAREEFLAHREDLVRWIDVIQAQLQEWRGLIERGDEKALEALVTHLAEERERWLSGSLGRTEESASVSPAQFGVGRLFLGGLAERGRKK